MFKVSALIAVLACSLGLVITGCGDDDDEATETATVDTSATTTEAAEETCPDAPIDINGIGITVSAIQTNAGCGSVTPLATDVLSRDDCVEESPAGSNECVSGEYTCTTTIPSDDSVRFAVSCDDGDGRHTEFSQPQE